jgi:hypothetical protein
MADTGKVIHRITGDYETVRQQLGMLADLAGTWKGRGFNLIARPDFHDKADLYLQLSQTSETTRITPIGSPLPNRGFGQDDISLFGLTYLQEVSDESTGGALHIEPGTWVTQPATTYPPEQAPAGEQLVFRQGSVPHGSSLLAAGTAQRFTGPPVLRSGAVPYAFSVFPSFNSTPFAAVPLVLNAAGSSEAKTAAQIGLVPFSQYDLGVPPGPGNPRTPFRTSPPEPPLPQAVAGVAMQDLVNDPVKLLQAEIERQVADGYTFEGVALNIATQAEITFLRTPDEPAGPTVDVNVADGAGGIANVPFLAGGQPTGAQGPNAQTALLYATFWIERVTPPSGRSFMQLQYAQMTVMQFPVFSRLHPASGAAGQVVDLVGWPHVSVATLRKSFG